MSKTFTDTYYHKGMRKKLIDELRSKGISNETVLTAMNNIPRHFFLDTAFEKIAYENRAFPIAEGQTISHPYTVAYQTSLLQVKKTDKILEVGTGSVYQATILAELGARIFTIERQKKLYDATKNNYVFKNKYLNIKFFFGDGFAGLPTYAPFDKIIVTAAAPYVPTALLQQLKVGGLLVIPVDMADGNEQQMKRITKISDTEFNTELFENFSFVPMLEGKN